MILSNEQITKALIRLYGGAGWSASLLFANPEDSFFSSRGPIKIMMDVNYKTLDI